MRIQLLDQERYALFESGSAGMSDKTRELLLAVANIIKDMPQKIEISGHTDAVPFAPGSPNDNFSLSSARADASRRFLETSGVPKDRVQKVVGRADREPLIPENPFDPANRRISVTLLSIGANDAQALSLAKEEKARQEADDGAPAPANADTAVQGGGPPALPADGSPPLPPGGGPPAPAPSAPVAPPPVTGTVPGTAPAQVGSTARDVGNPPAVIQPN